jgi:hypothetical protein
LFPELNTLIAAEPDKNLKQQLLNSAPDAWKRWKDWTGHTEAAFSEEQLRRSSPGKPVSVVEFQYYLKNQTRRRHFFRVMPDGRKYEEIAIRHGDAYYFTAERYDDSPLLVTEARPGPASFGERTVPPMMEAPYTVYYKELTELVKNPGFVFDVTAMEGKEPIERVRVTFRYDSKGDKVPRIREGWIELCPRDDWAVQEFLIKAPDGAFIRRTIQYGGGSGPQKPLVEVRTRYLGLDGKTEGDETLGRFKNQVPLDKHDEFYSFSAVGLPELYMAKESRGIYWVILLNVGIILVVFAFFMRRRMVVTQPK